MKSRKRSRYTLPLSTQVRAEATEIYGHMERLAGQICSAGENIMRIVANWGPGRTKRRRYDADYIEAWIERAERFTMLILRDNDKCGSSQSDDGLMKLLHMESILAEVLSAIRSFPPEPWVNFNNSREAGEYIASIEKWKRHLQNAMDERYLMERSREEFSRERDGDSRLRLYYPSSYYTDPRNLMRLSSDE